MTSLILWRRIHHNKQLCTRLGTHLDFGLTISESDWFNITMMWVMCWSWCDDCVSPGSSSWSAEAEAGDSQLMAEAESQKQKQTYGDTDTERGSTPVTWDKPAVVNITSRSRHRERWAEVCVVRCSRDQREIEEKQVLIMKCNVYCKEWGYDNMTSLCGSSMAFIVCLCLNNSK